MDTSAPWRALEEPADGKPELPPAKSSRTTFLAMIAVVAAVAVVTLAVVAFTAMSPTGRVEVFSGPAGTGQAAAPASVSMIVVQVSGAVVHPGVFSLPAGSRITDAIRAAGGYSADVDPRQAEAKLNLAAKLLDAQLIVVPRLGEAPAGASGAAATAGLLNLNTATAEQLDALPGIGPATATKIISSRTERAFGSVDDLVTRKLVTAATLAKFRDQVTVG
jgi:competence protein ComEA